MDYNRIYDDFIKSRRARESSLEGYVERHHIVPRCLGGGDEFGNIIRLTPGDHFFAHLLLAKIHGGRLWYALNALVEGVCIGDRKSDRRFVLAARGWYARVKVEFARAHSKRMKGRFTGEEHPMFGKPCPPVARQKLLQRFADGWNPMQSEASRAKMSASMKGRQFSAEWRENIARAKRGKKLSDAARANISAGHRGIKLAPATIEKIAQKNRGKKRTPEVVEAMRARLTGRTLSPEHVEKLRPHLARVSRFRGKAHTMATRERMAAVCAARRVYVSRFGGDARSVTIAMMRAGGVEI